MRCDNCKHWVDQKDEYPSAEHDPVRFGLGECEKATMLSHATAFRAVNDIRENERVILTLEDDYWSEDKEPILVELDSRLKMYVQDQEDYSAGFYTKPDFFCAHFEEKPSA